ncbi:hypothetical protein MRX96_024700 [Rhipicephalus microplus]
MPPIFETSPVILAFLDASRGGLRTWSNSLRRHFSIINQPGGNALGSHPVTVAQGDQLRCPWERQQEETGLSRLLARSFTLGQEDEDGESRGIRVTLLRHNNVRRRLSRLAWWRHDDNDGGLVLLR